ncbi:NAD(P)-dependent dehydrogenase (short-subunit alcohol dehydrogenase family) [Duganella sp. 1224]|uniref:SDR family oxidoreductase n=1 Tax=Duganella sp. 1224 TaxID=2587052 RepID=UPI0015CC2B93|nr:SDR family oxidoreductase [Duganella sp. 1224]NYE64174.1 NAD(P)-dependent dehydrogenase (short-subunit alcohol dehydrogenase family) [Duganella sp. 1224]
MKTILITGCSSGFGLATARYFLDRDWNVIATMRTPRADLLPASPRLRVLELDVADAGSIARLVAEAGPVDVLVNNAGIGALGALEGVDMATVRAVFDTNVFGTIAMTQAVLPQFRQRRAGVVINVTSSVTLKPLPLLSVYTGSKAAVNAFTESLALELASFNVRAHLVLPGRAPSTSFGANAKQRLQMHPAYEELTQRVFEGWAQSTEAVTEAGDVVEAIWRAATDPAAPMRIPAGADAVALTG